MCMPVLPDRMRVRAPIVLVIRRLAPFASAPFVPGTGQMFPPETTDGR